MVGERLHRLHEQLSKLLTYMRGFFKMFTFDHSSVYHLIDFTVFILNKRSQFDCKACSMFFKWMVSYSLTSVVKEFLHSQQG